MQNFQKLCIENTYNLCIQNTAFEVDLKDSVSGFDTGFSYSAQNVLFKIASVTLGQLFKTRTECMEYNGEEVWGRGGGLG